ncbi:MAG: hypothetical protein JWM28_9 [Chitinophagaceae bacterium]|nr:hypothetical protein [Chitinophagaceae bacterium]
MKILMIIDSLVKGGKERRMLELIRELTREHGDFKIHLVLLSDTIEYDYVNDFPITIEKVKRKYKRDIGIVFRLNKIIRKFRPDIIHSWSTMASIYISAANFFSRIPFINGVIADAPHDLNLSHKHYLRLKLTTPFSDIIISNSKAGIKSYKASDRKSVCIYNGVNFKRFENLLPHEVIEKEFWNEGKDGKYIIAMVAAFERRKDYYTLAEAAIKICTTNPAIYFFLIGDGEDLVAVRRLIPPDLLNRQIRFLGKRNDIESILQIIDIGILCTNTSVHGEGISNSIIEYMAAGKPIIATRGGGTDEVVQDGVNGFLVDYKNAGQIVSRVIQLFQDTRLATEMGKNGYQYVREQFDISRMTLQYIDLYRGLKKG